MFTIQYYVFIMQTKQSVLELYKYLLDFIFIFHFLKLFMTQLAFECFRNKFKKQISNKEYIFYLKYVSDRVLCFYYANKTICLKAL